MRKMVWCLMLLLIPISCGRSGPGGENLEGLAEDLWGNRIDLAALHDGAVLIQPFSPANCGYCLFDGEFVHRNYFEHNDHAGGINLYQCLFNPQLDVYTYVKHYRNAAVPVLTFPPSLHRYHKNGFPWIMAFRSGRLLRSGPLAPYEDTFYDIKDTILPRRDVPLTLTSSLHMAGRFVFENKQNLAVYVVPDGDEDSMAQVTEAAGKWKNNPATLKYEGDLTPEDLRKNLHFQGQGDQFNFNALRSKSMPIRIDPSALEIGSYRFPLADVIVKATFPNPHNRRRYVALYLSGDDGRIPFLENWDDYAIYRKLSGNASPGVVLEGLFKKLPGNRWEFCDSLAFAAKAADHYCRDGCSPVPVQPRHPYVPQPRVVTVSRREWLPEGHTWVAGKSRCRFPRITIDGAGTTWVVWEEEGDILLCSIDLEGDRQAHAVEHDESDSFSPLVISDGSLLWIFYLNNRDGFYRLYATFFDGTRFSNDILVSEPGPFDVVTPAAVSDSKGKTVVAWSEWKANRRFLKYRTIRNRVLLEAGVVAIKNSSINYVNAWHPSLVMDSDGRIQGAWNQHYPAQLGVCAGNLVDEATSVTRLSETEEDTENGGYPSIVVDNDGRTRVFWETFGWDLLSGKPQKILTSYYDRGNKGWSPPQPLSAESATHFNQTPRAAVDSDGVIWVVWSGRADDIDRPWGVYIARFSDGHWSNPRRISNETETARAPDIAIGPGNQVWVTWHSGVGDAMVVRVLKLDSKAT